jgi:hypothetical protein
MHVAVGLLDLDMRRSPASANFPEHGSLFIHDRTARPLSAIPHHALAKMMRLKALKLAGSTKAVALYRIAMHNGQKHGDPRASNVQQ